MSRFCEPCRHGDLVQVRYELDVWREASPNVPPQQDMTYVAFSHYVRIALVGEVGLVLAVVPNSRSYNGLGKTAVMVLFSGDVVGWSWCSNFHRVVTP